MSSSSTPPSSFRRDETDDSSSTAILLSIILEGVFLAPLIMAYCLQSWIFLRTPFSGGLRKPNTIMFLAGTLMFLLTVAHFVLSLHILLHVNSWDIDHKTTPSWYGTVNKAKFMVYVTQTLIVDGFMVYRLYVVWDRRWEALAFSGVMLLLDAAFGYAVQWTKSVPPSYFFVASLLTNLMCTVFIMGRVIFSTYKTGATSLLRKVIEGIIQSAAVYSAASIVLVITIFASPEVGYIACLNVFPPLIGLVFSSIVIRMGLQAAKKRYLLVSQSQESQVVPASTPSPAMHYNSYGLQPSR